MESSGSGEGELFYLHVLRHYMPKNMQTTYYRHHKGVAFFRMEGFEYKNYTSKHIMQSRNNGRRIQVNQSL